MKKNWLIGALTFFMLTLSPNLRAVDVTFSFTFTDDNATTIIKNNSPSGITLTLLNPSARSTFKADSDGIAVGMVGAFVTGADLTTFDLQVTGGAITLKSYVIQYTQTPTGTFSMSGGTGSSSGNSLTAQGTFTANGAWTLAPGETGTLTGSGIAATQFAQLKSMTFSVTPVPEPSTYALGVIATGVLAFAAKKRKAKFVRA